MWSVVGDGGWLAEGVDGVEGVGLEEEVVGGGGTVVLLKRLSLLPGHTWYAWHQAVQ